jgi:hypothetical protein
VAWDFKQLTRPDGQGDWQRFERAARHAYVIKDWLLEEAQRALTGLARELLYKHERLVHELAHVVHGRRGASVPGEDVHAMFGLYGRHFPLDPGPIMQPHWQKATTQALDGYRSRV